MICLFLEHSGTKLPRNHEEKRILFQMKKCPCLYTQEMDVTGPEVKGCILSKSQFLQLVWAVQSGLVFNTNPDSGERQVVFTTTPEINRQGKDVCAEVGLVLPIDKQWNNGTCKYCDGCCIYEKCSKCSYLFPWLLTKNHVTNIT